MYSTYSLILVMFTFGDIALLQGRFVTVGGSDGRAVARFTEIDQQLVIEDLLGLEDANGRTSLGKFA